MIKVNNLSKEFALNRTQRKKSSTGEKVAVAVDNLSFTCRPGRVLTLLGPNGAGKTTTLRMIASILRPTRGTVKVAGYDVHKEPLKALAKMGFLTGSTGLYDRLTPNEIIKYFGDLFHVPKAEFKQRKEELFTLLDMHDFAGKRFGALSTGMKQKVGIVRTLIHSPEVVVLDEPTSGLDVITASHIIDLIRDLKAQQKTVIFSSHVMAEVELLCDDLVVIDQGRELFADTLAAFRQQMQGESLTHEFIRIINESRSPQAAPSHA